MRTYYIAWWNVENLFDEENAVALGRRTDKVYRSIKDDIAGWTPELRDRKIDQLASMIATMNTAKGPTCSAYAKSKTASSLIDSSTG
jgi:hypothetical protein